MNRSTGPALCTRDCIKLARWVSLTLVVALLACSPPPLTDEEPAAEPLATTAVEETPTATEAPRETLTVAGTVRYRDLEGGIYVIQAGDTTYNPIELPQEFRVDGLAIEAEVVRRDDVAGVGMVGQMVEIVSIDRAAETAGIAADAAQAEDRAAVEGDVAAAESEADQIDAGETAEQSAALDETADPAAATADEEEATAAAAAPVAGGDSDLWGSAWQLQDLGGRPAMSQVRATLEFPAEGGRAVGNASCNRFFGQVGVDGDSIRFVDVGTMRMSCPAAINDQEQRFLAALEGAERYELEDAELRIFGADSENPIRFSRVEEQTG